MGWPFGGFKKGLIITENDDFTVNLVANQLYNFRLEFFDLQ
jgi:hypothetical protein